MKTSNAFLTNDLSILDLSIIYLFFTSCGIFQELVQISEAAVDKIGGGNPAFLQRE